MLVHVNGQMKNDRNHDSGTYTKDYLLHVNVRIVAHIIRNITQDADSFCLIFYTPLVNQGLGICWYQMTTTVNLRTG